MMYGHEKSDHAHVAFGRIETLGPCDELSWLNPTPRAIAVYASQPLSPVATQHSLPSGRYSLLGPDFHRLDRTSFALAHLLDYLVSEREHIRRNRNAKRHGSLEVDDKFKFGGLQNWQV
jgi:hypothetical protein